MARTAGRFAASPRGRSPFFGSGIRSRTLQRFSTLFLKGVKTSERSLRFLLKGRSLLW